MHDRDCGCDLLIGPNVYLEASWRLLTCVTVQSTFITVVLKKSPLVPFLLLHYSLPVLPSMTNKQCICFTRY